VSIESTVARPDLVELTAVAAPLAEVQGISS
jgi:hypothetical protein